MSRVMRSSRRRKRRHPLRVWGCSVLDDRLRRVEVVRGEAEEMDLVGPSEQLAQELTVEPQRAQEARVDLKPRDGSRDPGAEPLGGGRRLAPQPHESLAPVQPLDDGIDAHMTDFVCRGHDDDVADALLVSVHGHLVEARVALEMEHAKLRNAAADPANELMDRLPPEASMSSTSKNA